MSEETDNPTETANAHGCSSPVRGSAPWGVSLRQTEMRDMRRTVAVALGVVLAAACLAGDRRNQAGDGAERPKLSDRDEQPRKLHMTNCPNYEMPKMRYP